MKALIDYNSIKMLNDDGTIASEEILEFDEPKEDLKPHKVGTSWHPILQRYMPDEMVDMEMLVDESELFPKGRDYGTDDDDDPMFAVEDNGGNGEDNG